MRPAPLSDASCIVASALTKILSDQIDDSSEHAVALNQLARLLQATNRIADPSFAAVAIRLTNLGRLLVQANRSGEAEQLLRRALAIDEKTLGVSIPQSLSTSTT